MGKKCAWCVLVVMCAGHLRAQESIKAPVVEEIWEAAYLDNGRAGYFRTTFQPLEVEGQKVIRSRQSLNLTVKRFREIIQLRMQSGTDETSDGKVVAVFMQMEQSGGPLVLT